MNKKDASKDNLKTRVLRFFSKKEKISNRTVKKSRFLYLYVIFGPISGLVYFMVSLFFEQLPWQYALSPLFLAIGYALLNFAYRNYSALWMYASDKDRGSLMLYLNKHTHWSNAHKLRAVKWAYLDKNKIRTETRMKLVDEISKGKKLSFIDKKRIKYDTVYCPQQVRDGINEALFVDALIHAHRYIHVLDSDVRDIMNLTDEHILAFNLNHEIEKCTNEEYARDYARKMEIGKRASKKLKKC